jgi:hypothetical protein
MSAYRQEGLTLYEYVEGHWIGCGVTTCQIIPVRENGGVYEQRYDLVV